MSSDTGFPPWHRGAAAGRSAGAAGDGPVPSDDPGSGDVPLGPERVVVDPIDLSGYVLEPLHESGQRVLYRGRRRAAADGAVPSLLLAVVPGDDASPRAVRRLQHEHALAADLDPRWAARPAALVRHRERMALVLDDPGGEPLARLLGAPMEIGALLRLGMALAEAVAHVHGAGLVHKDLQPGHVLVDGATGDVRLTGFGIASRLRRERREPASPEVIAGTLAYMAPEQTGWMNRAVDSRSDLYAVGVVLYEMATGSLPFSAADPMEWVHCHLARQPMPPTERVPGIPRIVSAIIERLLAKTAEARYQTAAGLASDLRRCLAEWEDHGQIKGFALGRHDTPDRLLVPEKLYGREREVETLLETFDHVVSTGAPALVLVTGHSGIGKSSVVNELQKALLPRRGLFASGKCDQYKRDVPYSTLGQAFQAVIRVLLGKSETQLSSWRDALRDALGTNGQLLLDLMPELRLIIGDQPPVPELPPQQAQGRFRLVFRRLVGVFARPEHPLVLFLDDLQWLDPATLGLLLDLLTHPDVRHLLLIGAYRDNEVTPTDPLRRAVEAAREAGAVVRDICLTPLGPDAVARLIGDALRCEPDRVGALARLAQEKTGGNPFFLIQLLTALTDEGLLTVAPDRSGWRWDLERIRAKGYTDNVADLVLGRLGRLSPDTLTALQHMASLGHAAETAMLSRVLGTTEERVHAALWEAVEQEVLERRDRGYRFAHDRLREGAYALVPEARRAEMHLRIGRLLLAHFPPAEREEAVFDIVNQFNRCPGLVTAREEREQLAELNLAAGRRAKASAAYAAALGYLVTGAALLDGDAWDRRPRLAFSLELHRAECEFLTGALAEAEHRLAALAGRATDFVDRAAVSCLRVDLHTGLDEIGRAVAISLETLRYVGIEWSPHPTEEEARCEYDRIWTRLGSRAVEELVELPLMKDAASLATIDVLVQMAGPAQYTDANLHLLVVSRAVNLSLERGNCDASCLAYERLATLAGARFGDYQAGFRLGRLGYELVERRGFTRFQARTYIVFGSLVVPWTRHVKSGREPVRRGYEAASRRGDLIYAAHGLAHLNKNMLAAGDPLSETQRQVEQGLEFARSVRLGFVVDVIRAQLGLVRTLRGLTPTFGSFDDGQFDEREFEEHLSSDAAFHALPGCYYWVQKLSARFLAGDVGTALEAASRAQELLWTSLSRLEEADYHFYAALSRSAACDTARDDERPPHLEALAAHLERLRIWAEGCPENFRSGAALVGAELARVEGRELDAERLYEEAIRTGRANGFVHQEALAYELAARFYATRGFEQIAGLYRRHARHGYLSWGAHGKVRQLDRLHPSLLADDASTDGRGAIVTPLEQLELATVLKVSQAVSGELVLEKLVETLLRAALEHAGAERGLLLLPHEGAFTCQAEATTVGGSVSVRRREGPVSPAEVPASVLRYAARTQEIVLLEDAWAESPFSSDGYIRDRRARSVLCVPLVKQGRLVAVVYLENSLAPGVFDPARMAVLKVLASEAAMALENSRLYRDLEERETKIRRLVDANIVGVVIWDREGKAFEANDAFLAMVGYSREDVVAGRLQRHDLTPAEWQAATRRAVDQIRTEGRCEVFEKEYLRQDGGRVPVLVGGAALDETRTRAVSFVLDLTERRRSQEALQRAQAELAHISRVTALGELATSIAHEVNQPLAAIVTDAAACRNWLAEPEPPLELVRETLDAISAESHRAAEVIQRIRQFARKGEPRKSAVDVDRLVRDAVELVRAELRRQAVVVTLDLAPGLPPVLGDRVQLQQVILNLVMNAADAMAGVADRSRALLIRALHRDPDGVTVLVQDSGVGIGRHDLDHLFTPFFTTKPGGMGMGLAISRSIIEAHGGRLWATPNEPNGATFGFSLPVPASMA